MKTIAVYSPRRASVTLIGEDGRSIDVPQDEAIELAEALVAAFMVPAKARALAIEPTS